MSNRLTTEQILDAFAAEPSHDRDTLEVYMSKYPELRLRFLELAAETREVAGAARVATESIEDPGLEAAWSLVTSYTPEAASKTANPFEPFTRKKFVELCDGLGLPRGFVVAIRDKRVQLASIPERFLEAAARLLNSRIEDLRAYLSGSPQVISTAEFKASKKPVAFEQITFLQLIEDTELSSEQKATALEYLDDDGSD